MMKLLCWLFSFQLRTDVTLPEAAAIVVRKNFAKFTENTCARVSFLIKLQA